MGFISSLKKITLLTLTAAGVSLFCIQAPRADDSSTEIMLLTNISNYTKSALTFLENISSQSTDITQQDTSTPSNPSFISGVQANFASIGKLFAANSSKQNTPSYLQQLAADIVGEPIAEFSNTSPTTYDAKILAKIPNINSLSYNTLLGLSPVANTNGSQNLQWVYSYILNASGAGIYHTIPDTHWQGSKANQRKYQDYYNTVTSIESFNAYVLSNLLANYVNNGNQLTTWQNSLVQQASSSVFIAQIATETIGQVLRQILTFESQMYVLLTQIADIQRQLLNAQVMNNALAILNNSSTEQLFVENAQGTGPVK